MAGERDIAPGQEADALRRQVEEFGRENARLARENTRLSAELERRSDDLAQSLEYQAATGEVLATISRSTVDLAPVLQTLAETALRLCEAEMGFIVRREGEHFIVVTAAGTTPEIARDAEDYRRHQAALPIVVDRGSVTGRVALAGGPVQIPDIAADPEYRLAGATQLGKIRTQVGVPLLREGALAGVLILSRQRVEPFSERQVGLLRTFADQAVIAMENARLLAEQREALEQQTAAAQVLEVINASPGNLAPVFEVVLEKAMQLCGARFGHLDIYDGRTFRTAAARGVPAAFAEFRNRNPSHYGPGTGPAQMLAGARILYNLDLADDDIYRRGEPNRRALVDLGGARSALQVALRKDDAFLGFITLFRQEVRPFTGKQGALVQSFAAQAVIAMENARLIGEQREALEQQTATAEVLQVINASPGKLAPVFEAMLEKALRLCEADAGFFGIYDGQGYSLDALKGLSLDVAKAFASEWRKALGSVRPHAGSGAGRVMRGETVVHILDSADDEIYLSGDPSRRLLVDIGGARSQLCAALRKGGVLLGVIIIWRRDVRAFTDKQIALLESFAAQAVIAMENARLIGEQREALERQTATVEVLQVINASPGNLAPVFEAMLERAVQLTDSAYGMMNVWEGGGFRTVALRGVPSALMERWVAGAPTPSARNALSRIAAGEDVVHIEDLSTYESYRLGDERSRALVESGGARSLLAVALRKDGVLLGVLTAYRQEVRPFAAKQISLLQGFAQQAVIAMENARLLGELREALDQQTATSEILQVINTSPGVLEPVFDVILAKAHDLCGATLGSLQLSEGGQFRAVATRGMDDAFADFLRRGYRPSAAATLSGESSTQFADVTELARRNPGDPVWRATTELGRIRTLLAVPLLKDGNFLGRIVAARQEVRPFTDKQIALLESFAAQAVIAMENARLLGELREALDQQTATSDVLRTISRSSTDLGAVLETLVATVARLCRGDQAWLFRRDGNVHRLLASAGASDAERAYMLAHPFEPSRGNTSGRVALERRTIHIPDVLADPDYTWDGLSAVAFRTTLGIPLLREDTLLGVFVVCRTEVAPFTDKEIELASGFADQAVIAIENARLFEELGDREAELRVTLDNTGDGVVMFDAGHRLASWNRNFQEMLDISDAFVAGRPGYEDYVRLLIERGELGEGDVESLVASHRERFGRQWSTERTRPDGRIVEVRNNPVPDGGAVLIYADITERKRAEAAIAAARDAAEAALQRQTATADILKVIANSPTDLQPVLDAVAAAAVRFCGATDAAISLREGDEIVRVAHNGPLGASIGVRRPVARDSASARAIFDSRTIHQPDIGALDPVEFAAGRRLAELHGYRAALAAPMLRRGVAIGNIVLRKVEAGPFTPQQIELLETFAAQAVIAIENVRLFNDLRESLERQTATADILKVIASSPADIQPVLDAVVAAALRFCGAPDALIVLREGDDAIYAAHEGPIEARRGPQPLRRQTAPGRAMMDGRVVQIADLQSAEGDDFPEGRALGAATGFRSALAAPLLRDGVAIGAISLRRPDAGTFTPRQVELLETFAAQAVIAIENVRLFTELRDSLERQTATADILKVIASSPADIQPVLDAVVKAAVRFCGAPDAMISLREGDERVAVAHEGTLGFVAGRFALGQAAGPGRAIIEARTIHLPDIEALDPAEFPETREIAARHGFRASLNAPLLRDGVAIGCVTLRKPVAGPFTPQQIALLETFAAQAVIAIENVRLFTELRDALERQTATADILKAIASSPTEVQPVLDVVAKAAVRFCGATDAMIQLRDGDGLIPSAHEGPLSYDAGTRRSLDRAVREGRTFHFPDMEALDPVEFATARRLASQHGFRAAVATPLMRESTAIGNIVLRKVEPGPFAPQQIALLETFAAQAVIAIENVRLFTELRDALEQQTATADILKAIAGSPTDVQPVLEAVTRAALRFCGAPDALVLLRDGDENVVAAHQGTLTATLGLRRPIGGNFSGQALLEGRTLQIADVDDLDPAVYAGVLALAREHKWRSSAAAPMMHGGKAIGCVVLRKPEPGLLSPRQIALLETFAAQAVIAIENVRLFTELREALDQQSATSDVLKVIASSPTDVQPVLDAVAKAAQRFCGAADAVISLREGDEFVRAAHEGSMPFVLGRTSLDRSSISGCAIVDARTTHIPDLGTLDAHDFATSQTLAVGSGARAALAAPMLREGVAIGCILLRRTVAGPFASKQIELLEAFAAQAVIAIENVRLFTELRDSLERLKAAQANLIQSEKMASLGQLTAGIAHEIKNPLNFVNNFATLSVELLDELKETTAAALATLDEDTRAEVDETMALLVGNLGKIAEHGKRADGIVKSMLSHSRGGSGDWTPSDIDALVEEALNLAYHGARAQDKEFNVTLERDLARSLAPIEVVPQDVTRVFLNLIGNGFYAVAKRRGAADKPAGYRPTLTVTTRDLGEAVEVRVRDNGTGIPPDVREKLFQPFFTTKPTGEGTGLGLSISYDIVTQQHGGTIEVESEPGRFTEFTVRLPRRRVQAKEGAR